MFKGGTAAAGATAEQDLPLSYARTLSWLSLLVIMATSLVLSFFIANSAREALLTRQENYKTHFLVPVKGDKLLPLSVDMILFFYINDGLVKAVVTDGREYTFTQTLDELSDCLNPDIFFRVNRQYLISRKAVSDIDLWFNGRLSVNLKVPVQEKILVSKARVGEFKDWFTGKYT